MRRGRGNEFQRVGAVKKKDLRPAEELIRGMVSRDLSFDRRFREETEGLSRRDR